MNSNIIITKFTEAHKQDSLDILKNIFFQDEQMLSVTNFDQNALLGIYEMHFERYINDGLSFVAIDSSNDQVVGIQLNADYFITDDFFVEYILPFKDVIPESWALTSIYYTESTNQMDFQEGECINLLIGVVKREYRRQGILKALLYKTLCLAISKGFDHAISECTSKASTDTLNKFGFGVLQSVVYKDFVYDGRKPFESLEGQSSLMYKNLSECD
jgi:hypothetical protein